MPWQYKRADEVIDIASRKGFEVERAVLKDHWRLNGPGGNRARPWRICRMAAAKPSRLGELVSDAMR